MKFMSMMLTLFFISNASANMDEEDYSYNDIVRSLSTYSQSSSTRAPRYSKDPLSTVLIHGGVSLVNSYLSLSPANNSNSLTGFHSGVEATIGIDLFSRYWIAEGAIRSYAKDTFNQNEIKLKEFSLKVVHKDNINSKIHYRMGIGVAARYLSFRKVAENNVQVNAELNTRSFEPRKEYTTPSSILLVGIGGRLGQKFTLGAEIAYRGAMIDETIDKSALDAVIRLDAHF